MPLRKLSGAEIDDLVRQGCSAENWDYIEVAQRFTASGIRNCRFAGRITIGENVTIRNIGSRIADMHICDNARIEDTGLIETLGRTSFGVGTRVRVINEIGGREVPIYPDMTAQTAYVAAMFRDRPGVIKRFDEMVEREYVEPATGDMGTVGEGAVIMCCGILRNVTIDGAAYLEGVSILENCTIVSRSETTTYIGPDVKMYRCIAASGAKITNGSFMENCFVGGATKVAALSATNSLIFSNSQCENGELCSVFAGPFTISHHRSTLLIAGMFSFFNAGSGTNMSNHLFKAGPVHQGVFRRGVKLGSCSYVMLPSLLGPYNTVIGHHRNHPDTDEFPFSLLLENNGESFLMPGINLGSYGTARDISKWMGRDSRDKSSPDIINFDENNPFITQKVLQAIGTINRLLAKEEVETHLYKRVKIRTTMLKRGLKLYLLGKDRFLGSMMARREERVVTGYPAADLTDGTGTWLDVAGMYMTHKAMDIILDWLESGEDCSLEKLKGSFSALYTNYKAYAANWAQSVIEEELGTAASAEDVSDAIRRARIAATKLMKMVEDDERRERDITMATSYGVDAADDVGRMADYYAVRGIEP